MGRVEWLFEGDAKRREDVRKVLDRVGNGYILCGMRDLNGWVGGRVRKDIIGVFRLPDKYVNARKVVDVRADRELCV